MAKENEASDAKSRLAKPLRHTTSTCNTELLYDRYAKVTGSSLEHDYILGDPTGALTQCNEVDKIIHTWHYTTFIFNFPRETYKI